MKLSTIVAFFYRDVKALIKITTGNTEIYCCRSYGFYVSINQIQLVECPGARKIHLPLKRVCVSHSVPAAIQNNRIEFQTFRQD